MTKAIESLTASEQATFRGAIGADPTTIGSRALPGFLGKLSEVIADSPVDQQCCMIAFGDSLSPKVSGWIANKLITNYGYGNSVGALFGFGTGGWGANFGGIANPTLAGGAALNAAFTNHAVWPTGSYWSAPNGSTLSYGSTAFINKATAYYLKEPGAGVFVLETSPDNSTWTVRGTYDANATLAGAVASYTGSIQYWRFRVTSGDVKIVGFSARTLSTRRVCCCSLFAGGLSITDAAMTPDAIMIPILTDMAPSLVTIQMDDSAASLSAGLPTVLNWFRQASPSCSILLIGNVAGSEILNEVAISQQTYYDQLAATTDNCMTIALSRMITVDLLNANGWNGDNVHLADAVYQYCGNVLLKLLGIPLLTIERSSGQLVRFATTPTVKSRSISIGRNEDVAEALSIYTDASFGFDAFLKPQRSLWLLDSGGTGHVVVSSNEAVYPHQIPEGCRIGGSGNPFLVVNAQSGVYAGRASLATAYNGTLLSHTLAAGNILEWRQVTGSTALLIGQGFDSNSGSLLSFSLPAASYVGQRVGVYGMGSGGWIITQATGQQIFDAGAATTSGASGTLAGDQYESVELICIVANTTWRVAAARGTLAWV